MLCIPNVRLNIYRWHNNYNNHIPINYYKTRFRQYLYRSERVCSYFHVHDNYRPNQFFQGYVPTYLCKCMYLYQKYKSIYTGKQCVEISLKRYFNMRWSFTDYCASKKIISYVILSVIIVIIWFRSIDPNKVNLLNVKLLVFVSYAAKARLVILFFQ